MNGVYAFVVGVLLVIAAWITGRASSRKETVTKMKVQISEAENRAAKAETEKGLAEKSAETVVQHTAETDAIKQYFVEFEEQRTEAESTGNIDGAIEAAKRLAERATQWRQRNK